MLCTHYIMTEFADLGCTHAAGELPRSQRDGHGHTHAEMRPAVVALPGACEGSLLHRCARGLRELNLQAMFYNI